MPTDLPATGAQPAPGAARWDLPLALAAAVLCGALIAVQSRFTGRMSESTGAMPAAWWSFGSGFVVLTLALVVPAVRSRLRRLPAALRAGRLRWWHLLGGVFGALVVATQSLAVPLVGVSVFLVALVGGQTVNALVVDRLGIGPAPAVSLSPSRVLAAVLAVAGVTIAALSGTAQRPDAAPGAWAVLPVLLAFAVGLGAAFQQAINARVNRVTGNPVTTAWCNFALGCGVLLLIGSVPVLASGLQGFGGLPWWSYLGGVCGVFFIALAAWAVAHSGVLLFGLVSITSQMSLALVLDLASPTDRDRVGPGLLAGITLTALAAIWAAAAAQRVRSRRSGRSSAATHESAPAPGG